jgi:hypothetical protein
MAYHVAALSPHPVAVPPPAPEPPRRRGGAAEAPSLLPTLVDWALERLAPAQLLSDPQSPDRSVRIAMVAGHFDALAQLARQPAMQGVHINAGALVVDAGLMPLRPAPGEGVDAGVLVGAAHGSLRGPGKEEAVAAAVGEFLERMAAASDTQVVVVGSYGRPAASHRAETVSEMDRAMGKGRRATADEEAREGALWSHLDQHVAAMGRAKNNFRAASDAVLDFWYDVKPGMSSWHSHIGGTRSFVSSLVLERFRPLIDGLRHALKDRSIDPERAHALVAAALEETRRAVQAHDEPLPAAPLQEPAPAPVLSEAQQRAQDSLFLPVHSATPEQAFAEGMVWQSLDRVIGEVRTAAEGGPGRLTSSLEQLRGRFAAGASYEQQAMEGRSYLRNIVLQSCLPATTLALDRLQSGEWDAAAAAGHVEAVIAAHRDAVGAHNTSWPPRS